MKPFEQRNKIVHEIQDEKKIISYIPINKGQFTLETVERETMFEKNRASDDPEGYKEYRRQWFENPKQHKQNDYPLHVDIELASICNLKCPMCYTVTKEFKEKVNTKLMSWELYTKIIDEIGPAGVYSIRLSLRGESFLHKRIIDCVKYAKDKGIKEISTLTNGVKLDEAMFAKIMEAGIDWITISFDGIGETYERIRKPAKFDRAVEKIKNYQQIKKEAGRVKPVIKVQSVLPAIRDRFEEYYDIFSPITDMVSSNPLIDYLQNDGKDLIEYVPNFSCSQLYQRLVIGADGLAMMCSNDEENDYVVGDANKESIHEIWHGEKLNIARDLHRKHLGVEAYGICRKCYLPRQTEPEELNLHGRKVLAENYTNRKQLIGE
ncbi:radical SAM protein [Leptospira sp. FAT2]|uniref:radical SAM/SPASM domain-containing protein n=1 Tax=Leptospira sanjuanensis TaxID=2879643 RepID=UPI001EE81BE4|nr:radical SAM/SPASM domain-containing protein [Leptospira sanjuanensis]MCG6167586.1 radical SAM protein [Leptospira sanjuanensis]MCG6193005.1 radical SAM protein [Leptospira sanjuanensis]